MRVCILLWLLVIRSNAEISVPQCLLTHRPQVNDTNAPHIFNSIADSMRQWGSSYHFNGMSLFLAQVPAGTELYRGTVLDKPVKHLQWLAFEPEHALAVVRGRIGSHIPAYLHTYRTTHALRFIYIDGQSAAKTRNGTLDTQDYVIRDATRPPAPPPPGALPPGALGDSERAEEMCKLAQGSWRGLLTESIAGFIRMQGGFEIILCPVHTLPLRVVSIHPLTTGNEMDNMAFYLAVASRYDGIGLHRVRLDYEHMLPLWAYGDMVYMDHKGWPRVNNHSSWLRRVKRDLRILAMTNLSHNDRDWQSVTDMVQLRYGDRIQYLTSSAISSLDKLKSVADPLMDPFIDFEKRDPVKEAEACAQQFWPEGVKCGALCPRFSLAAQAVHLVALRICQTFAKARRETSLTEAVGHFQQLREWLGWSSFKRCRGCAVDAICVLPIWPLGTKENYRQPTCYDNLAGLAGAKDNFWYS